MIFCYYTFCFSVFLKKFYDSCRFRLIILSYVKWDESLCLELLYTMFFVGFFLQILNKVVIIIQIEKLMPINLILQDHKNNPFLLIELVFPMDKNLLSGEFGKISKYKDVENEIKRMWHLKPTLIPVIVGALGTVKKKVQTNIYNKSLESQV